MLNKFAKLISIAFIFVAFNACSYLPQFTQFAPLLSYVPTCLNFSGPNLSTIEIQTNKLTNDGTPFYALVKATDFPSFLADDYQKIAALVAYPPEDQKCFAIVCIVPGITQIIKIETPESKSIAVYCLFTHPGEIWKHIFELQEECPTIKIELGENEIISVE